uniref:NAD-dependent epimerase/dehydratase domain-containing protein n=1 Tax=Pinguiococcus pyrenoidosus TaxID=172671 RepID=A0A7R9YD59_9STRA
MFHGHKNAEESPGLPWLNPDANVSSEDLTDTLGPDSDDDLGVDNAIEEAESRAVGAPETVEESKTVLVTGAAGFIGSHVAYILLNRGDKVVVLDEVNDYYDPAIKQQNLRLLKQQNEAGAGSLKFYHGDCCDAQLLERIWQDEGITHVVHLAARAGVRPSIEDPFVYLHSNIEATTRLMEVARKYDCKHFVFASSSSVYGGSSKDTFSEEDVVNKPVSPYAATKAACELLAHTWHTLYGLQVAGLRFFTVYGPRGRPDMAPFKFIHRVFRGQTIQQFGDGTSSRDYTYIDDIAAGVVRALDRPRGYQIYNLGNGNPVRLRDFIQMVGSATGKRPVIEQLPDQPGDVPRTCADISKARRMLGYVPAVTFKEGLERTAAWYSTFYLNPVADDERNDKDDVLRWAVNAEELVQCR